MGFDFSWWVFCVLRNKYTGKKGRGLGVVPCAWVGFFSRSPLKCTSKRMWPGQICHAFGIIAIIEVMQALMISWRERDMIELLGGAIEGTMGGVKWSPLVESCRIPTPTTSTASNFVFVFYKYFKKYSDFFNFFFYIYFEIVLIRWN